MWPGWSSKQQGIPGGGQGRKRKPSAGRVCCRCCSGGFTHRPRSCFLVDLWAGEAGRVEAGDALPPLLQMVSALLSPALVLGVVVLSETCLSQQSCRSLQPLVPSVSDYHHLQSARITAVRVDFLDLQHCKQQVFAIPYCFARAARGGRYTCSYSGRPEWVSACGKGRRAAGDRSMAMARTGGVEKASG